MTGPGSATAEGVLIAAFSGRGLAASARMAGYAPLVADLFGDADTAALASRNEVVAGDLVNGFDGPDLLACLERLGGGDGPEPVGFVYGAGFEANPELLAVVAKRWRLLGNSPDVVASVKAPGTFAGACARLGVPHPEIADAVPERLGGWLCKRSGGAGGAHIALSSDGAARAGGSDVYFQRQVAGRSVSALFAAAGGEARVLGFSEQWRAPAPAEPFRFGGAVQPADLDARRMSELTEAIHLLARYFELSGLNSADFVVGDSAWWILEINPRPGATLDIFDMPDNALFAIHLDAIINGRLPPAVEVRGATAAQIVYASKALIVPPDHLQYPDWTVDQPRPGVVIEVNNPFCTVLASEDTACEAKLACEKRENFWRSVLEDGSWTRI